MALLLGGLTVPILSADPTDNPDTGKAFVYATGTSYKIKYSNGDIFTFATGITPEDVQDIVGTFITSGNTKLQVSYNDAGNVLVLTVQEGNIVHQNLSGAGTNTHAQIDSHIANASNPHATTAAQVGADPVGSASAAQSFSIQRANHTGTQTASTISDFSEAVDDRVSVLLQPGAGISLSYNDPGNALTISSTITQYDNEQAQDAVGNSLVDSASIDFTYNDAANTITANLTNTPVAPGTYGASGVPQFTVDAQGRITAASNGPALVIGDNFEEFSDLTPFVTTSNLNQVAAQFNTTTKQTGLYRLGICWDWTINVTNADAIFSIFVDGVLQDGEFRMETSETATQNIPFHWTTYLNFATETTHTIELRARAEVNGNTVTVNRVRAEIWRAN